MIVITNHLMQIGNSAIGNDAWSFSATAKHIGFASPKTDAPAANPDVPKGSSVTTENAGVPFGFAKREIVPVATVSA